MNKFCYTKQLNIAKTKVGVSSAVAFRSKYWPKYQEFKIYFIDAPESQKQDFVEVLDEVLDPLTLTWKEVDNAEDSDLRISFKAGYGSYSYLGTDAKFIPKDQETMNIGWRGKDVIRHELLHSIGAMGHEQQNPREGIIWNEQAVIDDLKGSPNFWTEEQIRFNVLDKVDIRDVDATLFDKDSIMLYYIPPHWTLNGPYTNYNTELSQTDREFLFDKYGKKEEDKIAPVITLLGNQYETVEFGSQYTVKGATAVDNVDGYLSDQIKIEGQIDTFESGLQYLTYSVTDSSGNYAEKIRTVMVLEEKSGCLPYFLLKLFPKKSRLGKLTESQLIVIATELGLEVKLEDLKKDTVDLIWNSIQ